MSNNKQSSVIDIALEQIYQRILDSLNPNAKTKRTGDYRIGLNVAIDILSELKELHKQEIKKAFYEWQHNSVDYFNVDDFRIHEHEQYYNKEFGGNNANN